MKEKVNEMKCLLSYLKDRNEEEIKRLEKLNEDIKSIICFMDDFLNLKIFGGYNEVSSPLNDTTKRMESKIIERVQKTYFRNKFKGSFKIGGYNDEETN